MAAPLGEELLAVRFFNKIAVYGAVSGGAVLPSGQETTLPANYPIEVNS